MRDNFKKINITSLQISSFLKDCIFSAKRDIKTLKSKFLFPICSQEIRMIRVSMSFRIC